MFEMYVRKSVDVEEEFRQNQYFVHSYGYLTNPQNYI